MYSKNKGIGTTAIIIAAIALLAVVGIAAYMFFPATTSGPDYSSTTSSLTSSSTTTTPSTTSSTSSTTSTKPSTSTTTSTSTSSTTSTKSSTSTTTTTSSTSTSTTTSSSSTITTTTTTSTSTKIAQCTNVTSTNTSSDPPNLAPLFDNFSKMTLTMDSESNGKGIIGTWTYSVLGRPIVNGIKSYTVQFVMQLEDEESLPMIATVDPTGKVSSISQYGQNFTGALAQSLYSASASPFMIELQSGQLLSTAGFLPNLNLVNQTTLTLGSTSVSVTYYKAKSVPFNVINCDNSQTTINDITIGQGKVSGVSSDIITYYSASMTTKDGTFKFTYKLTSVTKA